MPNPAEFRPADCLQHDVARVHDDTQRVSRHTKTRMPEGRLKKRPNLPRSQHVPEAGAKHATPRGSDATSSTSTEARQGQHHDVAFKSIFLHAPNVSQSTNCCCLCKDTCLLEVTLQEGRTQSHPPEIIEYVRRRRRAEGANPSFSEVLAAVVDAAAVLGWWRACLPTPSGNTRTHTTNAQQSAI